MNKQYNKKISVTIDVETDWGGRLEPREKNCQGIFKGLPLILSLLEKYKIKATFFVSGNVAEKYGDVVIEIDEKGHEIASHGYDHLDYSRLTPSKLSYQLKKSKGVLENILNKKIIGFRVPQCRQNNYLYKSLNVAGYEYDSSVIAGAKLMGRYNYSSLAGGTFTKEEILEIPISTIPLLGLPFGLLWINAITFSVFRFLCNRFGGNDLSVFYLHPFDVLPQKLGNRFGFIVGAWYSFNGRRAIVSLDKLLAYFSQRKTAFTTLNQISYEKKRKVLAG